MLALFRDHKVACWRLRQGQTWKDFEAEMRDELSVYLQLVRVRLHRFSLFWRCAAVRTPSLPLRREERPTWKVGTPDLGERSKAGMSRSPQSEHLHRAHRGVLFSPACLLIITLSLSLQSDRQTSLPYHKFSLCSHPPFTVNTKEGLLSHSPVFSFIQ